MASTPTSGRKAKKRSDDTETIKNAFMKDGDRQFNMNVFDEIVDEGDVDEKEYLAKNLVDLGKGRRQTQFYYSLLKIQEHREEWYMDFIIINIFTISFYLL